MRVQMGSRVHGGNSFLCRWLKDASFCVEIENIVWVIGNNLNRCNNLRKSNSRSWFSSLIERRRRRVCSKSCCIVLGMLGKCRFCSKSYNFIILGSQLSKAINRKMIAINRKMIQSSEINGKWNNVEGKGLYNVNWITHRHHHLNLVLN